MNNSQRLDLEDIQEKTKKRWEALTNPALATMLYNRSTVCDLLEDVDYLLTFITSVVEKV